MNLELFPDIDASALDDLVHEIDTALDSCFLSDMDVAFESRSATSEPAAEAPAA